MKTNPNKQRKHRHARVRAKISGTSEIPRVAVFKSNKYTHVQIIDDSKNATILSANDRDQKKGNKTEKATATAQALAKKAAEAGISKVVFDRGGFKYHGRVKAVAEGLRKGGLKF